MTTQSKFIITLFFVCIAAFFFKYAVDTCLPHRGSAIFSNSFQCVPPVGALIGAKSEGAPDAISRVVGSLEITKPGVLSLFNNPSLFFGYVPKDAWFDIVLGVTILLGTVLISALWSRIV